MWSIYLICTNYIASIIASLENKQQELLIEDPSNPNPQKAVVTNTSVSSGKAPALSRSTTSVPAARPSIRETIAAQKKRAKLADTRQPDRPGSADSIISSPKIKPSSSIVRPATAVGSLSSAPVRPFRMAKKPDSKKQPAIVRADAPVESLSSHSPPVEKTAHFNAPSELSTVEVPTGLPAVEVPTGLPAVEVPTGLPAVEVPKGLPAVEAPMGLSAVDALAEGDVVDDNIFAETTVNEVPTKQLPSSEARQGEILKVYEDPFPKPEKPTSPQPSPVANVLEELPVNKKFNSLDSDGKPVNTPVKATNVVSARRLLDSGIVRVRARTLDIHGFRKLQGLIRNQDDIWGDGSKFDELLLPLLEFFEEPNDELKPAKALDLKTQVFVTVQLMLKHQPKLFSTFYPRALCAILTARKHIQSTSHIVYGLGEMSKLIAKSCEPEDCIDAVLDLLETETSEIHESSTLFMGMSVLEFLLYPYAKTRKGNHLTSEQEFRMGRLATRCLAANSPDIRRAVLRYILQLNDCIEDEPHFWKLLGSACEDHRDLITYYIAKRAECRVPV